MATVTVDSSNLRTSFGSFERFGSYILSIGEKLIEQPLVVATTTSVASLLQFHFAKDHFCRFASYMHPRCAIAVNRFRDGGISMTGGRNTTAKFSFFLPNHPFSGAAIAVVLSKILALSMTLT